MSGLPPTIYQNFCHVIGRALRETGQCLHRLGVKTTSLAITKHDYYDDPVIYEDHLSRHRQLFPLPISGRPIVHAQVAYIAPCATLIGTVIVGRNASIWYGAVLRGDTCENTISLLTKYTIEEEYDSLQQHQQEQQQQLLPDSGTPESISTSTLNTSTTDPMKTAELPTPVASSRTVASLSSSSKSTLQDLPKPWKLSETRQKDQLNNHGGMIQIGNNTNVQDAAIITSYQNHCIIGDNVTIGHCAQLHSCTVRDNVLIGMGSIIQENVIVESFALIAAGAVVPANTVVPTGTLWMGNPARNVRPISAAQRQQIQYQSSEYVKVARTHDHVMELGGNVDKETGVSVYITSDQPQQQLDDTDDTTTTTTTSIEPSGEQQPQPPTLNGAIPATTFKAEEPHSIPRQRPDNEPWNVASTSATTTVSADSTGSHR